MWVWLRDLSRRQRIRIIGGLVGLNQVELIVDLVSEDSLPDAIFSIIPLILRISEPSLILESLSADSCDKLPKILPVKVLLKLWLKLILVLKQLLLLENRFHLVR